MDAPDARHLDIRRRRRAGNKRQRVQRERLEPRERFRRGFDHLLSADNTQKPVRQKRQPARVLQHDGSGVRDGPAALAAGQRSCRSVGKYVVIECNKLGDSQRYQ